VELRGREVSERKVPETLEEAYELRDASATPQERGFYQEHVYRLRAKKYRSRGIRIEESVRAKGAKQGRSPAGGERRRYALLVGPNSRRLGGIERWALRFTGRLLPKSRSKKPHNL
jgi:hypothetical protein